MDPSERIIIKSRSSEENVPAIPVIVAGDESGLPERVTALETEVAKKQDKKVYEVLYEHTFDESATTLLAFSDIDFNNEYEEILIDVVGENSSANASLVLQRNETSATTTISSATRQTNSHYRFRLTSDPYLLASGDTGITMEVSSLTFNSNTQITSSMVGIANSSVREIESLLLGVGGSSFLAGAKIKVWGVKGKPITAAQRRAIKRAAEKRINDEIALIRKETLEK